MATHARRHGASGFVARVTGQTVRAIGRRGKHLIVELDDGDALVIHRRMSGNLIFLSPEERDSWARVVFGLDDGRTLVFSDPRKFGRVLLVSHDALGDLFADLGPEPLEEEFTPAELEARLRGSRRAIKAALLDQTVVVGLGNIYADEALFRAGINPLRPSASLSREEIARLRNTIRETSAIGHRAWRDNVWPPPRCLRRGWNESRIPKRLPAHWRAMSRLWATNRTRRHRAAQRALLPTLPAIGAPQLAQ